MQNRRAVREVPKSAIGVQILVDGYVVAYGEVSDISLGGAGLWAGEDFKTGDRLELRLEAEDRLFLSLQTRAEVVWCRSGGRSRTRYGIRWAYAPGLQPGSLQDFIAATCTNH